MYKTIKNIDFPMVQTIKNTLLIFLKKYLTNLFLYGTI